MTSFIPLSAQLAFAGFTHYAEHWGFFASIAAAAILLAVFSNAIPFVGPYLTAIRKDLYWVAFGCALCMLGMVIGGRDGDNRCVVQQQAVGKTVDNAVNKTTLPAARHQKDPWDNPKY